MCTLALSLGISMIGCQKNTVHPETPTTKARTLSNAESDSLVAEIGNFYSFCSALAANPNATTTQLPPLVSLEQANGLLENTFNYYFARLNPAVVEDKNDTLVLDVAPDAEGNMNISSVAQGFNSLRASLKSFQSGLGNNIEFLMADAEIVGEGNEARIRLVGTFGEPTVTEDFLRVTGFNSNETWKIFKKGGQYGTTAYDNLLGAPEVLTAAINHDLPVPTTGFIVNISDYPQPWNYLNPPAHYLPSTFGASANPMYLADSVYWKNTLMHLVYYGTNPSPLKDWITPAAMTYYRTWMPKVAQASLNGLHKVAFKVNIGVMISTATGNYPIAHFFEHLYAGDFVIGSLPSNISL